MDQLACIGGEPMTIKAVDMQVLIPKVNEVGKIQHIQEKQGQEQQQEFAHHLQEQAAMKQHTVQQTPKGQGGKVDEKRKGGQGRDRKKGKEREAGREDINGQNDLINGAPVGKHIDIKV